MKRMAIAVLFGAVASFPAPGAHAEAESEIQNPNPVVVELFTAQGCPVCPAADAKLASIAELPDVIALSLHVDYWDYLGWADTLASPAHTKRQRAYADALHEKMIYTPQMVFQGREHAVGSQAEDVDAAIARQRAQPAHALVRMRKEGDMLVIAIAPGPARAKITPDADVLLAYYTDAERVTIDEGENKGADMLYRNVVADWSEIGPWRGETTELRAATRKGFDGVAALVQAGPGGPILGAARMALR